MKNLLTAALIVIILVAVVYTVAPMFTTAADTVNTISTVLGG